MNRYLKSLKGKIRKCLSFDLKRLSSKFHIEIHQLLVLAKIICDKNARAWMVGQLHNGVNPGKEKSWEQFGMCQLKSTANSAQFGWNQAGLAVLFGRQIPGGFHQFIIFLLLCTLLSCIRTIYPCTFCNLLFRPQLVWISLLKSIWLNSVWSSQIRAYF